MTHKYILTTTQDTPYCFGLLSQRTYPILGVFDTRDDAHSYAHNVCGFATSAEFFVDKTRITAAFIERWDIAQFATSRGSVVACSFKPTRRSK